MLTEGGNKQLTEDLARCVDESFVRDPSGNVTHIREQGDGLLKMPTGSVSLQRVPAGNTITAKAIRANAVDSLGIEFARPVPKNAIGVFHTHPAILPRQAIGPSIDDIEVSNTHQLPGVVYDANDATKKLYGTVYDNKSQGWF